MSAQDVLVRLAVAAALGCLVGLERHRADKAAGMRTHMLVSLGSALFMIVSAHGFDRVIDPGRVTLDPSRIAAQVVSGIGFLGAGTILRRNETVFGLTTAASIWAVAAVGLAAGGGLYSAAASATGLTLFILTGIRPLEERVAVRGLRRTFFLLVRQDEFSMKELEDALRQGCLVLKGIRFRRGDGPENRLLAVTLGNADEATLLTLTERLHSLKGVSEVSYEADVRSS